MANSAVASATYTRTTQTVATPTFNPAAGTYVESVSVSIATTTSGATIHYTTDGSAPTTASTVYGAPITLTKSATIRAIGVASGMSDSAEASASYTLQVAAPTFSPPGRSFNDSVTVTLTTTTAGASIHYTTDGSTPTTSSAVYSAPLVLTQTTTVKAMAAASGMANSTVASATYTRQTKTSAPTFTPPAGTYIGTVAVTLASATPGATIHYTTDGSNPNASSPQYTGPIVLTATTTIRAIATANGQIDSDVVSATYTIQAAPPVFSPASGTYIEAVNVSLSTTTSGATIYYTTNGTTPTTASAVYSAPIAITQTTTIRAVAAKNGITNSTVTSATYTVQATPPTFNPSSGTYYEVFEVTLTTPTNGAIIRYTIDGSVPNGSSPVYTEPIWVPRTKTIRAMTTAAGKANSSVASASYTLQAVAPTFDPPGGSFALPQLVSLSSPSPGATIYYTTDGSTPTTSSPKYLAPVLVLTTTTIRAIAVVPGWSPSTVSTATYRIGLD
jgi:hypothetical protein